MTTINFTQLQIEVSYSGETETINVAKELANWIKMRTTDIGFEEFCRKIYFSEDAIEIPEEYTEPLTQVLQLPDCPFFAPIKRAIIELLTIKK